MSGSIVLFVSHVGRFGGSAFSFGSMVEYLHPSIHRVCVGSAEGPVLESYLRSGKVDETIPIRWRGRHAIGAATRLAVWAWKRRREIVAIQANGTVDVLLAMPAAIVTRRPFYAWIHDQAVKKWPRRLAFVIRRLGIRWIAVSDQTAQDLVDAGLARPGEVMIIHNPVDPRSVAGAPRVTDRDVRIGFLGTDTDRKGFPLVPEVARRVTKPGVRFLVFANRHRSLPPHITAAWRALDALGPERVEIVGKMKDVPQVYARCDIVFVASLRESYCRVVVEAMANGVPVVASDLPPIRQMMGEPLPGFLFPTGDVDAAVAALERLAGDPDLRARLGALGRARAAAFAPPALARRFDALYGVSGDPVEGGEPALDASAAHS